MTRFARAKGSKSSNERVPDEATPWNEMKMQLEQSQSATKATSKPKTAKQLLADQDEPFYPNSTGNVNHEWASFGDDSDNKSKNSPNKKIQKTSIKVGKKKATKANADLHSTNDNLHEVAAVKNNQNETGDAKGNAMELSKTNIALELKEKHRKESMGTELAKVEERGTSGKQFTKNTSINSNDHLSNVDANLKGKKRKKTSKSQTGIDSSQITTESEKTVPNSEQLETIQTGNHPANVTENSEKLSKRQKRNQKKQRKLVGENDDGKNNLSEPGTAKKSTGFDLEGNEWSTEVKFGKLDRPHKISNDIDGDHGTDTNESPHKNNLNKNGDDPRALDENGEPQHTKSTLDNSHLPKSNNSNQKAKKRNGSKNENKEYKRRKPDEGVINMVINGNEIQVVRYDGFPVKKEDAERLQELKKSMIMKGIPRADINIAMKLERRKAEKALARERKRVCFHCRKSGHNLSDCPELGRDEAGSGICFKCGSAEHTHFECKVVRGQEFRHASCFICREQGHIARQCPDNPRGLYPQGGSCKICGDVTHLKKDCPDLMKEKEETNITVDKIEGDQLESLEDNMNTRNEHNDSKSKSKIVKF